MHHFKLSSVLEVVSLVASILPIVALFQIFDGVSAVTNGVLRARGRQVRLPTGCALSATDAPLIIVHRRASESFVSRYPTGCYLSNNSQSILCHR